MSLTTSLASPIILFFLPLFSILSLLLEPPLDFLQPKSDSFTSQILPLSSYSSLSSQQTPTKFITMSTKPPVFTMLEPHHFSDYGFDPQFDYFQVLEEARKHKRDAIRSIDTLHFKLQKPISKDDPKKKRRQWWWKNAVLFFKTKWAAQHKRPSPLDYHKPYGGGSISGPIYFTEYSSGSETTSPCRKTSRPTSGPIAGTLTPTRKGDLEIPYMSLKDLNMDPPTHVISSTPMPIYLVT